MSSGMSTQRSRETAQRRRVRTEHVRGSGEQRDLLHVQHPLGREQRRAERKHANEREPGATPRDRPERSPRDGERLPRVGGEAELPPDLRERRHARSALSALRAVGGQALARAPRERAKACLAVALAMRRKPKAT